MKRFFLVIFSIALTSATTLAQPEFERIGVGLSFASKRSFNNGFTGNPGLNVKSWIAIDARKMFHVVPSITLYNPLEKSNQSFVTTNTMLHGDLDLQYRLLHEKTLKLVAIAGFNYTHIISKNFIVWEIPYLVVTDDQTFGFGPNIGAALEMRMGSSWDFIASAKYSFSGIQRGDPDLEQRIIIASLASPVIQIHGVYYFSSRGKGYSKR